MIFQVEVTNIDKIELKDGGKLYKLGLADKSKPMSLRCETLLTTFLSEDKRKLYPSGDELDGFKMTLQANSLKQNDGAINIKGRIVTGHVSPEEFEDAFSRNGLSTKPEKTIDAATTAVSKKSS